MKKKAGIVLAIGIVIAVAAYRGNGNRAVAEDSPIDGQGNLIMELESVKFYSDDVHYLKLEIDKLLNECK